MPTKLYWTRQSREDLRAIRGFIARDAPKTASAYVRRLRHSAERLRDFPYSGQVVPELGREELREVIQGNYRIIYRVGEGRVDILNQRGVSLNNSLVGQRLSLRSGAASATQPVGRLNREFQA